MVINKNKSTKPVIQIKEMHKWFGNFHVLKNISLGVNQGERIVICGPSGSGKSTIAQHLDKELISRSKHTYILDGDNLRSSINKDLGFSQEDRIENNRRIAHISKMMFDSGVLPIVTTISPNKDSREFARSLYSENDFSLIYVKASLDTCMERDQIGRAHV